MCLFASFVWMFRFYVSLLHHLLQCWDTVGTFWHFRLASFVRFFLFSKTNSSSITSEETAFDFSISFLPPALVLYSVGTSRQWRWMKWIQMMIHETKQKQHFFFFLLDIRSYLFLFLGTTLKLTQTQFSFLFYLNVKRVVVRCSVNHVNFLQHRHQSPQFSQNCVIWPAETAKHFPFATWFLFPCPFFKPIFTKTCLHNSAAQFIIIICRSCTLISQSFGQAAVPLSLPFH